MGGEVVKGRGCRAAGRGHLPVGVRGGQHELEFYNTGVVFQLPMLDAVQLVGNVGSPHVHLGETYRTVDVGLLR